MAVVQHPYYPVEMVLNGYRENDSESGSVTLISIFASGCAVIFLAAYLIVIKVHPKVPNNDLFTIMWFILSGYIYLFIEGYCVLNFRDMPSKQDLFGQFWKVYSLSDSRYQSENAFVLCMETVTAICWGPLCLAMAILITIRHPLRYPLQAIVSLGQLYGDILYYGTSLFDHDILGLAYSRLKPLIFWGLFVFLNTFWILIPSALICTSLLASKEVFTALSQQGNTKKVKKNQ